MSIFNKYLTLATLGLTALVAAPQNLPVAGFSDSFESNELYRSYWSAAQMSGTVSLSKSAAYSGAQAVQFAPEKGGPVHLALSHVFPAAVKGDVSIAFFDNAEEGGGLTGAITLYHSLDPTVKAAAGVLTPDATRYTAEIPGGGKQSDGLARTVGWHVLTISTSPAVVVAVDGKVLSGAAEFVFDTVEISVTAGPWRTPEPVYFDAFSFTPFPGKAGVATGAATQGMRVTSETAEPTRLAGGVEEQPAEAAGPKATAAVPVAAAPGSTYLTVSRVYISSLDLSCPSGYTAVAASCCQGEVVVIHDRFSAGPVIGYWTSYLIPNASQATGVHCNLNSPFLMSTAFVRCVK